MSGEDGWCVEFHDFRRVSQEHDEVSVGELRERAVRNRARHGTPVLVSPSGRADARVNWFFRTGPMAGARPATLRRYAYALKVWLDFLDAVGKCWDHARAVDMESFKDWRLTDHDNAGRIAPTSFDTDRAALNSFYRWAAGRYGVVNPVSTVSAGRMDLGGHGQLPARTRRGRRDGFRPAGSVRRQVKWLLRLAFEQWRDVGLRGYGFGGLRRTGWEGGHEDRDAAFVDGLYGTGLRLSEWASVLDIELPEMTGLRYPRARLAAAVNKGGRHGRSYFVPRGVLSGVDGYRDAVEGSRAQAIRRAQQAGRYERVAGLRVVTGFNSHTRLLYVKAGNDSQSQSLERLGAEERRYLFRMTEAGLEPLALWLSADGLPKQPHSWEKTFDTANRRIQRVWHSERHGPGPAPLFARPHMCRHSFALRWYSILSVVWQPQVEGLSVQEVKDLREQFGDVWYQLAGLLGHADPSTTRDHYLEPFTSLRMDYLLSLLDGEEFAAVDALVRAVAEQGGRTLGPVIV